MVEIKISRHAKRRYKLYKISEPTITGILKNMNLSQGKHEIVKEVKGFKYPLKIVVAVEGDIIVIITNYPLRKGRKK
ncbi:MAG: hypothetical protein HY776_02245 [Actinobacteria bacterium]|nr:hypothetical protein [Actinomycetota bacterium]